MFHNVLPSGSENKVDVFLIHIDFLFFVSKRSLLASVAEPPLFWAAPAPAPDGQGPGADSGSDLLGSAPAPGKKRRLQAAPAPAPYTKIFHFNLSKS